MYNWGGMSGDPVVTLQAPGTQVVWAGMLGCWWCLDGVVFPNPGFTGENPERTRSLAGLRLLRNPLLFMQTLSGPARKWGPRAPRWWWRELCILSLSQRCSSKRSRCPSTDRCVNTQGSLHAGECYLAVKRKGSCDTCHPTVGP